jgi:hypothetical protein
MIAGTKLEAIDCPDRIRWWMELRERGPGKSVRALCFALSTWMDPTGGSCYPTQEQIARAMCITSKSAQLLIKAAERQLWIRVVTERKPGRGWRHCRYVPTIPVRVCTTLEQPPTSGEMSSDNPPQETRQLPTSGVLHG